MKNVLLADEHGTVPSLLQSDARYRCDGDDMCHAILLSVAQIHRLVLDAVAVAS